MHLRIWLALFCSLPLLADARAEGSEDADRATIMAATDATKAPAQAPASSLAAAPAQAPASSAAAAPAQAPGTSPGSAPAVTGKNAPSRTAPPPGGKPEGDDAPGKTGMRLFQRQGPIFIAEVVKGSPAETAGVQAGEQVVAVDGGSVEEQSLSQVIERIKGPIGSPVKLTLVSPGKSPREVVVTRGKLAQEKRAPQIATSALPRLKVFASRQEIPSLLQALLEVEKANDPAELKAAYPTAVAAISRSDLPDARKRADELFGKALELAPRDMALPEAAEGLYLKEKDPRPADARRFAESALKTLKAVKDPDRSTQRVIAAWTAVLGQAELAAGEKVAGMAHLEASLKLQPGDRMAALTADGKVRWSSSVGPKDRWEKIARQSLEARKAQNAADLALEALRWSEDPTARTVLEASLKAGAKADSSPLTGESWPVTPADVPDVTLTDIEGRDHTLSSLRGKVVFITLWATWCGPCHQELEALKSIYASLKDSGFEILAISVDQDTEAVAPFVRKKALPFPAGLAPRRPQLFRTTNVPIAFLIDKDGRLSWSHVGYSAGSEKELEARVRTLLAATGTPPRNIAQSAWHQDRLLLTGHKDLARVIDVAFAQGPQGPQIWALKANGTLDVLRLPRPADGEPEPGLELESLASLSAFNGFDRLGVVDLDADRISERVLYKGGEGDVVVENILTGNTRMFLVGGSGVSDARGIDLDRDGRQELLIGYRGRGVRAVDSEGAPRWWLDEGELRSVAAGDVTGDGRPDVVIPGEEGQIRILDADGKVQKTFNARGPAERLVLARLEAKSTPAIVARDRSLYASVALDLNGDGRDEIAGISAGGILFILGPDGALVSRVTLKGERLSLAAGDLNLDGRDELIVGGEGLGVAVIDWNTDVR